MVPEIGHFALILALCIALVQSILPLVGAQTNRYNWIAVARPAAYTQLAALAVSYGCLTYSFLVHDFSVLYVANNSNSHLPTLYLYSGVWGAHEGSLLLWALVLSIWTSSVAFFSKSIPHITVARVISVLGIVMVGFLLFLIITSNPFERIFPAPLDGRDLNPLLQDIGLAIHPPMLYMGYVGFSVAFAFAIAALIAGRLDSAWARWSRPWTNIAWAFMTIGIALGSWWAYYELGWGGWWFWDPVENASFMPWIVGTALMHSLIVTEKRGTFKAWTVLLAIFAFSLSLLGTFLVRSGVLTSVHAFASDPARGVFILIFLCVMVGGSLLLYAWRAPQIKSASTFEFISRETGLLVNNVILVAIGSSILLGTLYPLVLDAITGAKISVGPPYFGTIFLILLIPLTIMLGFGQFLKWKEDDVKAVVAKLKIPMILSLVFGTVFIFVSPFFNWQQVTSFELFQAIIGSILGLWVMSTSVMAFYQRIKGKPSLATALLSIPRGFYGMTVAHIGMGVFIVGMIIATVFSLEKDVRLEPGESYSLADYTFKFNGVRNIKGPNYNANEASVTVTKDGETVAVMRPQKRIYRVQRNAMTEAAIDDGLTRDLFVALGEKLDDQGAWSVRLYHKPFLRWIWLGSIFMAIGGLLAASDRRYLLAARRSVKESETAKAALAAGVN